MKNTNDQSVQNLNETDSLHIYSLLIYKHSLKRNKVDLQAINFWSEEVWAKGLGKRFIQLKVRSFFKLSLMGSQTTF